MPRSVFWEKAILKAQNAAAIWEIPNFWTKNVCVCVCVCVFVCARARASEFERICALRKYTLHHAVNKSITANLKCAKFATEVFH